MNRFSFTELEDGEQMVFGPVTTYKTTSVSFGPAPNQQPGFGTTLAGQPPGTPPIQQGQVSRTRGVTIGVTNRRVIVEDLQSSDRTQILANEDVRRVYIKRKTYQGKPTLTLVRVQTGSGQTLKLNLEGIPATEEGLIRETFPNAEVLIAKGILGSKGCMIALAIVGALVFLSCVGPMLLSIVINLFQ